MNISIGSLILGGFLILLGLSIGEWLPIAKWALGILAIAAGVCVLIGARISAKTP